MNRLTVKTLLIFAAAALPLLAAQAALAVYPRKDWTYRIKPDVRHDAVAFLDGMVVIESTDNTLHFVDIDSGGSYWRFKFYAPADIYAMDKSRLVAFSDGIFHILDTKEKSRKWSIRLKEPTYEKVLASTDGKKLAIKYSTDSYEVFALGEREFPVGGDGTTDEFYELDKPVSGVFRPGMLGEETEIEIEGAELRLYRPREATDTPVWPPPGSEPAWTYDAGAPLVGQAAVVRDRILAVSEDSMLHFINIKTGEGGEAVPMSDLIDMRFWDEIPENIDNYENATMYTYGGNAYIAGPSHFTKIGLRLFPSEITLKGEEETRKRDKTENWALERAINAWDTKNYQAAIAGMREVVSLWPDSAVGHLFLGMAFSTTGHVDEAISELEAALKIDPQNPDIAANLSGNYYLKIMTLDPRKDANRIIAYYDRIKEIRPTNSMAYVGLAELYLGRQEFGKAADVIKESFDHGFMGPDMHALLLSAFYMNDERARAIELANEMIRFFPDSDIAYIIKGKLLCKIGRYNDAIAVFEEIGLEADSMPGVEVELASSFPRILTAGAVFFYGNALGLAGRYWDGIALLKDYLAAMPSEDELEALRSFHQKTLMSPNLEPSPEEAALVDKYGEDAHLVLSSESKFRIPATLAMAQFLYFVDYRTRSMSTLAAIEEDAASDPETLSYIGYLFAKNGRRLDDAKEYLETALESDPGDAIYNRNYAVYLTRRHRFNEAEKHFKKALEVHSGAEMLNYEYGLMLLKTGRYKEAAERFRKELDLVPDLLVAKEKLEDVQAYIR